MCGWYGGTSVRGCRFRRFRPRPTGASPSGRQRGPAGTIWFTVQWRSVKPARCWRGGSASADRSAHRDPGPSPRRSCCRTVDATGAGSRRTGPRDPRCPLSGAWWPGWSIGRRRRSKRGSRPEDERRMKSSVFLVRSYRRSGTQMAWIATRPSDFRQRSMVAKYLSWSRHSIASLISIEAIRSKRPVRSRQSAPRTSTHERRPWSAPRSR